MDVRLQHHHIRQGRADIELGVADRVPVAESTLVLDDLQALGRVVVNPHAVRGAAVLDPVDVAAVEEWRPQLHEVGDIAGSQDQGCVPSRRDGLQTFPGGGGDTADLMEDWDGVGCQIEPVRREGSA